MHYKRFKKHGDPLFEWATITCTITGCDNKHMALGYCNKHWLRLKRHGSPTGGEQKQRNYHGKANTREYRIWQLMKERCTNTNNTGYHLYGGRGIKICNRWLDEFENFLEDMGESPSELHSIDRIDGNGNYEPENCRWATSSEQCMNKKHKANRTGYRGVYIDSKCKTKKYKARLQFNGIRYNLGSFYDAEQAALAYDSAVMQVCPEFGHLNYL